MDLLQAVDGGRQAGLTGLELQREEERVVPGLVQVDKKENSNLNKNRSKKNTKIKKINKNKNKIEQKREGSKVTKENEIKTETKASPKPEVHRRVSMDTNAPTAPPLADDTEPVKSATITIQSVWRGKKQRDVNKDAKTKPQVHRMDSNGPVAPLTEDESTPQKTQVQDNQTPSQEETKQSPVMDSDIDDESLMFGKMENKKEKKIRKGEPLKKKKKLLESTLLRNLEAQEEKIKRLKEKDPEAADEYLQEKGISKALARASGERIYDSKRAIQKTIKRNKKRKQKSASQW